MTILVRDVETRSQLNLKSTGPYIYAADPTTEVLCVAYAVDDGPVELWRPGKKVPKAFAEAAKNRNWLAIAHNTQFEMLIERYILGPRHGFPIVPLERNRCTMAMSNAAALPGALEKVAKVLNLKHQKDLVGNRIMLQMIKPRKARKAEAPGLYWYEDPERMTKLFEYCRQDVETERELYLALPELSDHEQQIWQLDQRINERGFHIDQKLARAAKHIADVADDKLDEKIAKVTDGRVTTIHQVKELTSWVNEFHKIGDLTKKTIEDVLEENLPDNVREALELRADGAQAAVKKAVAFLNRCNGDGRVRGAFIYHAAGPGRWASRGVQVQNLKRIPENWDINKAITVIRSGDYDKAAAAYPNPLLVIGNLVRSIIDAAPGHVLIGADFSGIEARVTAWLAGEQRKLKVFRNYDAGTGPDPYKVAASKIFNVPPEQITKEQRQVGKGAELAFGFQGGVGAYRKFSPAIGQVIKTPAQKLWEKRHGKGNAGGYEREAIAANAAGGFTDEQVEDIKKKWRRAHPNIEIFWHDLNRAAWRVITHHEITKTVGRLKFECDDSPYMWLTLPSGRQIGYPQARKIAAFDFDGYIREHERGHDCIIFKDSASGRWHDVKIYGGLLCENVVQGTARDLLAEAMERIERAGFAIVGHVHDECIIEVPERDAQNVSREFAQLMMQSPSWAEGLPIIAKPWVSKRYVK